jgi:hypothetical protein
MSKKPQQLKKNMLVVADGQNKAVESRCSRATCAIKIKDKITPFLVPHSYRNL